MLDFKVQLALGDETLTEAEWRELLAAEQGLVLLRGQWVEVDRDKLTEALRHWKKVEAQAEDGLSFIEGMRLLAGAPRDLADDGDQSEAAREWSFVRAGDWLGEVLSGLRSPESLERAKPGAELKATLRAYQETGVDWLWFMSNLGLGACLADDMGLGKTIQVLALLLVLKKQHAASRRCWFCRRPCWRTGSRRSTASPRRSAAGSSIRRRPPRSAANAWPATPARS